jgi:hypothetical protein
MFPHRNEECHCVRTDYGDSVHDTETSLVLSEETPCRFLICDLATLSLWRLYSVDDTVITGCETVVGTGIGRGNRSAPVPLCPDLGSSPGRRGGKPATYRLSWGRPFLSYSYATVGINIPWQHACATHKRTFLTPLKHSGNCMYHQVSYWESLHFPRTACFV